MDDEDDSLLLDNEGNIKSAQPDPDLATDSPEKTPRIRLTTENFRIVREQSDPVRTLISTRDSIRNFSDTNLRLYGQSIKPRWLGRPISPPILPENISLPTDFHNDWRGISTLLDRIAHARRLVRRAKLENVSYTDFIALAPSRQTCLSGGSERNKVGVRDVLQFCTPH